MNDDVRAATGATRLSAEEMKTVVGGLRSEWMDDPPPPEANLKALWMDDDGGG
jgi:hypothetical protein